MKPLAAVLALALAGVAILPARADDEAEPLDATRCWTSCRACERRCRHDSSCAQNCADISAACCEANGRRPLLRGCGCL